MALVKVEGGTQILISNFKQIFNRLTVSQNALYINIVVPPSTFFKISINLQKNVPLVRFQPLTNLWSQKSKFDKSPWVHFAINHIKVTVRQLLFKVYNQLYKFWIRKKSFKQSFEFLGGKKTRNNICIGLMRPLKLRI